MRRRLAVLVLMLAVAIVVGVVPGTDAAKSPGEISVAHPRTIVPVINEGQDDTLVGVPVGRVLYDQSDDGSLFLTVRLSDAPPNQEYNVLLVCGLKENAEGSEEPLGTLTTDASGEGGADFSSPVANRRALCGPGFSTGLLELEGSNDEDELVAGEINYLIPPESNGTDGLSSAGKRRG